MANRKTAGVIAMIPAKVGSVRLPAKNLALLGGKPLVYYAIKAAKGSGVFDRVIINAEDDIFSAVSRRYGVDFYRRPDSLVRPDTKTDEVVYDFLKRNPCDIVAWVSPIAPLAPAEEVAGIVKYFIKEKLDSLMTVRNEQVHCVYDSKPVNFRMDEIFAQTQDLIPVQAFTYSVMMWRSQAFISAYEKKGYALLCGKVGFYPVGRLSSVIIKKKEDLMLAEAIYNSSRRGKGYSVRYDRILKIKRAKKD